mmetsp:Transcript_1724/g.2676  ORF Transcript_1724/g.2676 Transcript_1724/m.2676 type:complete len:144 (+) Transcript_1724:495-926(+)
MLTRDPLSIHPDSFDLQGIQPQQIDLLGQALMDLEEKMNNKADAGTNHSESAIEDKTVDHVVSLGVFHPRGITEHETALAEAKSSAIITPNMLASVMRTCNMNGEFGLFLLYKQHVGLTTAAATVTHDDAKETNNDSSSLSSP